MNEKELKRLSRRDLLELLLAQTERIEELEKELKKTKTELSSKKISIKESGSIAEASLKISGIFEKAQETIDIYQKNLEAQYKEKENKIVEKIEKEMAKKLEATEKLCAAKKKEADDYLKEVKKSNKKESKKNNKKKSK